MNNGNVPKYLVVKNDLKRIALDNDEGHRIPSISELVETYGVSTTTVIKAVKDLTAEGYLNTIQGDGTFVAKPRMKKSAVETRNIGLVISEEHNRSHPYLVRLTNTITDAADEFGYNTVFVLKKSGRLFGINSANLKEKLASGFFDGLLLVSPLQMDELCSLIEFDVPFVNISNEYHDQRIHSVSINHFYNAYLMVRHCIERGRRNILYISGPPTMNGHHLVLSAYKDCLAEHQLAFNRENFVTTNYQENEAYEITLKRFSGADNRPDTIITKDGTLARGVYYALEKLGLAIPGEVIVVQGNELFANSTMRKMISYLDLDIDGMCRKAAEMLVNLIEGKRVTEKVIYTQTVLRECPAIKAQAKVLI